MMNQPDPRQPGYTQPPEAVTPPMDNATMRSATTGGSYVESRRENYVDPTGNQVENQVEVYENKNLTRENVRFQAANIIYFVLAVLEIILGLRFLFRLFGASQDNGFILFLYGFSNVFVAPFNGIFHDQTLGSASVFELSTLVAMLILALIAWGLVSLCRVVFAPDYSGNRRVSSTWRRQR